MAESPAVRTRFIAITSGKGGVGKSTISSNLSYLLAQKGLKVAVFDADLGLANLDVMYNVRVGKNILHVLKGEASVKEILIPIRKNLILIPGESGEEIFKYSNSQLFERFMREADVLDDMDVMIIDTGAGISEATQLFLQAADDVIVVTVPDPAAITDAYATIKVTARRRNNISMILNQVRNDKEAYGIFSKIKHVAEKNISGALNLDMIGKITLDDKVSESVKQRKIFIREFPSSVPARELGLIADKIIQKLERTVQLKPNENGLSGFFKRLLKHF
ncbi:MAG: ATP-binding protein [Epsilonproteobacteria bacterium]|nr:MAG: ATP-binding protein [Campylobacterota bacterium]